MNAEDNTLAFDAGGWHTMPITTRPYREDDWPAVCTIHDRARPDELTGACDPRAFVPLAEERSDAESFRRSRSYWLWSAFFSLVFVLGLLGALYREDWAITEQDIVMTKSIGPWRKTRRVAKGRSLRIHVEVVTGGDEGPIFPYRLHLLGAAGPVSGLQLELQLTRSVDQILGVLGSQVTLEVDDPRNERRSTGGA